MVSEKILTEAVHIPVLFQSFIIYRTYKKEVTLMCDDFWEWPGTGRCAQPGNILGDWWFWKTSSHNWNELYLDWYCESWIICSAPKHKEVPPEGWPKLFEYCSKGFWCPSLRVCISTRNGAPWDTLVGKDKTLLLLEPPPELGYLHWGSQCISLPPPHC